MNNGFTTPVQFTRAYDKVDGSVSLSFVTDLEIDNEDFVKMRDSKGMHGWLLFRENEVQDEEVPSVDAELDTKSKSQRLRGSLYRLLEQELGRKPTEEEWSKYYHKRMEAIIDKIKERLEP